MVPEGLLHLSKERFCPSCQEDVNYDHKQVKRFGTLYFIPLLPLDELGDYVECQKCKNTYNQRVLGHNPEKDSEIFQAEYENAIKINDTYDISGW